MDDKIKSAKDDLRAQALRNRAGLGLDPAGLRDFCDIFLSSVPLRGDEIIGGYWAKDREFDVSMLLDELLERGHKIALPVVEKGSRLLKFAPFTHKTPLIAGAFGILQPQTDDETEFVAPDLFLVPMLAFDRAGNRLGFGGGYYDTTLSHFAAQKPILKVGVAYAEQACLFRLPAEEHDIKMDWIITQQKAHSF